MAYEDERFPLAWFPIVVVLILLLGMAFDYFSMRSPPAWHIDSPVAKKKAPRAY